jgi:hypothetical protein
VIETAPPPAETPAKEAKPAKRGGRLRRWLRRLVVLLVVAAVLYLFRVPLLRWGGGLLVVEEPAVACDHVLIFKGDLYYDRAAQALRDSPGCRVLLIQLSPRRLETMGLLVPYETTARQELAKRGVADIAVTVLHGQGRTDWDRTKCLADWLRQHPDAQVDLLCGQFGSRRIRLIVDRVLGADAGRVHFRPVPHPWYDDGNWWQRKEGVHNVFSCAGGLVYAWWSGDTSDQWRAWDPDEFEKSLAGKP